MNGKLMTFLCLLTSAGAFSQSSGSMGTQAREECVLQLRTPVPDVPDAPVQIKQNPKVSEEDAKVARKNSLKEFLAARASKKRDKVISSSIAQSKNDNQGLIGNLLILLIIIGIFALVVTIFPGIVELALIALLIAFFVWLVAVSCRNC